MFMCGLVSWTRQQNIGCMEPIICVVCFLYVHMNE